MMVTPGFNGEPEAALIGALNGALGLLGDAVRAAIYERLHRDLGLGREAPLQDPAKLVAGLQNIFRSAFPTIETLVWQTLHEEYGVEMAKGSSLLVMIETVRQRKQQPRWGGTA